MQIAKVLQKVVEQECPQIVLLGKQSIDSDNNQTGQMLSALTGMPQATFASKIAVTSDKVQVTREIDGGLQTLELLLPAIITTDLRLNEPRYATLPNIMKAKRKPVDVIDASDYVLNLTSNVTTIRVTSPIVRKAGVKVATAAELIHKLKNEAKVIP